MLIDDWNSDPYSRYAGLGDSDLITHQHSWWLLRMMSKMPTGGLFALAMVYSLLLCFVSAENLVENGDFEDLVGYFPAGVLVRRTRMGRHVLIPHWNVSERCAPVEVISSRFWQSSISAAAESLYAVHLNTRAGPGGIQQEFPSPWINDSTFGSGTARYELSFDVAGNPNGGASVKRLEVILSPSECMFHKFALPVAPNANSKRLNWKTERLVLEVQGSEPTVILKFQSLTQGAYGPLIDNVRLSPVQSDDADSDFASQSGSLCDTGNDAGEMEVKQAKPSAVEQLLERVWMSAETWIRQRFLRRKDW